MALGEEYKSNDTIAKLKTLSPGSERERWRTSKYYYKKVLLFSIVYLDKLTKWTILIEIFTIFTLHTYLILLLCKDHSRDNGGIVVKKPRERHITKEEEEDLMTPVSKSDKPYKLQEVTI